MVIQYFELAPVTGQIRAKRMRMRCARKEKSDEKIGASGLLDSAADVLFTDSYSSIMALAMTKASGGDSRNLRGCLPCEGNHLDLDFSLPRGWVSG